MMMGLFINTNVQSLNAQRMLGMNNSNLAGTMTRLSSGLRINRASDDAAGLSISEKMRSQIRGSQQANSNVQDAVNLLNTADGALDTITSNLQRMRELAVQGSSEVMGAEQRSAINLELSQLKSDISRIAKATTFNDKTLLDGSVSSLKVQLGAGSDSAVDVLNIGQGNIFTDSTMSGLSGGKLKGGPTAGSVTNMASALQTISALDASLKTLNNRRASIGAMTNRLQGASANLNITVENMSASESRIRNADIAKESATLAKYQVLTQASTSILSQANQSSQAATRLLG
ncbi:MAG: flagellin [Vampirovibrionales bacterium]